MNWLNQQQMNMAALYVLLVVVPVFCLALICTWCVLVGFPPSWYADDDSEDWGLGPGPPDRNYC